MAPSSTETPAQANARFTTIFQQHGGPNKHKHVPSRATLQRWQAGSYAGSMEKHWASIHLEFANNGAFFKATRKNDCAVTVKGKGDTRVQKTKKARPAMQIFALEDWGARILAAHVDAAGNHRGRDSTYRWARDPVHGLNPDEAPAGHAFVKAPPKEAIIQFLKGCAGCSCGKSKSAGAPSTTTTTTPAPAPALDGTPAPAPAPAPAAGLSFSSPSSSSLPHQFSSGPSPFSSFSSSSPQALAPPAAPPAAHWAPGTIDPALLSPELDFATATVSAEEAMATLQAGMLHQFGMQPEVQQEQQPEQEEQQWQEWQQEVAPYLGQPEEEDFGLALDLALADTTTTTNNNNNNIINNNNNNTAAATTIPQDGLYLGQPEEDFAFSLAFPDTTTTTTTTTPQDAMYLDQPAEEDPASFDPFLFQAFADEASALLGGEEPEQQQQESEQPQQEATDLGNATEFFDFDSYCQE
ncbi:hypothetical protein SLS55_006670 [Diplodia seriata]|uniref:Uncharacterized protein n=1 Tax=Diplodia seriata TaxID=420778 RepID=A0ABR3CEU4_9PEZI